LPSKWRSYSLNEISTTAAIVTLNDIQKSFYVIFEVVRYL